MNGQLPPMPSDEEKRAAVRKLAEDYHIKDVNSWRYEDGATPLTDACQAGDFDLVRLLVCAGADIHFRREYYGAPINIAAGKGHVECCRFLLEHGADIHVHGYLFGPLCAMPPRVVMWNAANCCWNTERMSMLQTITGQRPCTGQPGMAIWNAVGCCWNAALGLMMQTA